MDERPNGPFDDKKISKNELELKRKEIFGARDVHLKPLGENYQAEYIPGPRRTELAAKLAAICLDYCISELTLVEPDRLNVDLYQKPLDHAKELTDSIAGKVKRFQPPSKAKERKEKPQVIPPAAPVQGSKLPKSKKPQK